jgi:hypothetical protein
MHYPLFAQKVETEHSNTHSGDDIQCGYLQIHLAFPILSSHIFPQRQIASAISGRSYSHPLFYLILVIDPYSQSASTLCSLVTLTYNLQQWYSTFFVRVSPDIISFQFCTPKVDGV